VANAVYNATGIRIRDYPLTLDKVLNVWAANDRVERRSQVTGAERGVTG
jgi:xanthine dehydrogenase YagR molybdenum-binding subunit